MALTDKDMAILKPLLENIYERIHIAIAENTELFESVQVARRAGYSVIPCLEINFQVKRKRKTRKLKLTEQDKKLLKALKILIE